MRYPAFLSAKQSELASFLSSCRGAFLGVGLMTAMINVLYLTGSFFMLEIYDLSVVRVFGTDGRLI